MIKITLRSYNREIETLIEQGKIDLAIAHSLQILKFFPKHVDTYRLLGKAYLENKRLGDAADVFQRVLSAVPEDFVSHIGMSIIREDEGNLDASIWHMQRAYDIQSSNVTIQDELRRLYEKRDGIEPPKIRLTRAALARMYARGDLVNEAITELRSALQEDPDRADLLVLLARMYYTNQQRVKSIQTCSQVLNKLPYCLEGNLIISQALNDTNRSEEAEQYLERAKELDPHAAYLSEHAPTIDLVPDSAVTVTKLDETDYLTGTVSAQPAWVASLGAELPETEDTEDDSDWLFEETPVEESKTEETADLELDEDFEKTLVGSEAFSIPFTTDEETPETESALFDDLEPDEEADEPLPEWMQEAGWQSQDSDEPEAPPAPLSQSADEGEEQGDDALTPAEIPDWLQAMAPKELSDDTVPNLALPEEDTEEQPAAQDIPDWLQDLDSEADQTVLAEPVERTPEGSEAEDVPDWLLDNLDEGEETLAEAAVVQDDEDIPDWLKDLALDAEAENEPTQAVEDAPAPALLDEPDSDTLLFEDPDIPSDERAVAADAGDTLPDWLQDLETGPADEPTEPVEAAESAQDWLASLEQQEVFEVEEVEDSEGDGLPEWLLDIAEGGDETAIETEDRTGVSLWLRKNLQEEGGDLSLDDESEEYLEADVEALPAEEASDETEPVRAAEDGDTIRTERPAELSEMLDDERTLATGAAETPTWLQGLDEELLSEPEEEAVAASLDEVVPEEMPDLDDSEATFRWLESLAAKQGAREDELLTSPEERTEEPPEWVRNLSLEEEAGEPEPATEDAVDDWLAELSADDIPESQIEESAVEADTLDWGDIEEEVEAPQEAAEQVEEDLSWLEELTIEESEEEFLVQSEETVEDAPAWAIGPAVEADDIPDWLKEDIGEPVEEAPEQALPDWLQEVDIEEEEVEAAAAPESDLPEWLEATAVDRGEPEVSEEAAEDYAWEQDETILDEPAVQEEAEIAEPEEAKVRWWQKETGPLDASILPDEPEDEVIEEPEPAIAELEPEEEVYEEPEPFTAALDAEATDLEVAPEAPVAPVMRSPELPELAPASAALKSGDVAGALDQFRKFINKKRQLPQIIAELKEALEYNHPVNIDIWATLGDAYAKDDQLQNALDAYTKAEELLR